MNPMRYLTLILTGLLVSGCTRNAASCDEGAIRLGVAEELLISRAEGGVSAGFNLDGKISSEGGGTGCGIADYEGPNGEVGVDNAIARLVPALELTEAIAAEDLILQAINSGELLVLFRLSGLEEDSSDDSCVSLDVLRGVGEPIIGSDGYIVSGQTFDIDTSVTKASATDLILEDNVVVAHGLRLEVPLNIFDATLNAVLEDASVRVEWDEEGNIKGYFGGSLDYWSIVDMAINSNVDAALAASLPVLFGMNADLEPDSNAECTRISFTFVFEGKSAFLFED
jgi:hypothetical protein